ncbi:MAG: translocation/assembly module TamB [Fusobacteriaceae bacterium]|jgi:hypothetical protein|nr:translocation/assembly module TamB [Fusobacteriaceae bacterium]
MSITKFNREYISTHRKKIIVFLLIIFVTLGLYYSFRYHLSGTVTVIARTIFGVDIKSDEIKIGNGKIIVINPNFSHNGQFIGKASRIEGTYSKESLKKLRIENVEAYGVEAVIVKNKKDINAVTAFVGSKNKKFENSQKKMKDSIKETDPNKRAILIKKALDEIKKTETDAYLERRKNGKIPGGRVPIDKITVMDGICTYIDNTFANEIKKKAHSINGFITFDPDEGIHIEATGESGDEKYKYTFSNKDQRYWMDIEVKNISPRKEWIQYGYIGNDVAVWGGKIDLKLEIGSDTYLKGGATGTGLNGKYVFYNEDATNINGKITFDGRKMVGECEADVLGHREKVVFNYDGVSKFYLNSKINDVSGTNIFKYYLLEEKYKDKKEIITPENLTISSPQMNLFYDSKADPKLTILLSTDKIQYDNYIIENLHGTITRGTNGIEIKDVKGHTKIFDKRKNNKDKNDKNNIIIENDIGLYWKYGMENGKVNFQILKDKNSYIPYIEGSVTYLTDKIKGTIDVKSNIANFVIDYFPTVEKLIISEDNKFIIEYDVKEKKIENGKGIIDIDLKYLLLKLQFAAKDNIINLKDTIIEPKLSDEIESESNENSYWKVDNNADKAISITGTIDLNKNIIDLKAITSDFLLENKIKDRDIKIKANLEGTIKKDENSKNVQVDMDIKKLAGLYIGEILDIKGELSLNIGEKINSKFDGEIGKISYKNYTTDEIKFSYVLYENTLKIIELKNKIFNINGDIDIDNKKQNLAFSIVDMDSSKLNIENINIKDKIKFYISKASGNISGSFQNPVGKSQITKSKVTLPNNSTIDLKGDINYKNGIIYTDKFFINENLLKGEYNIKETQYSAKIDIKEKNLAKYYGGNPIYEHRVTGTISASGKGRSIDSLAKITIDENYMNWNKFPNVYVDLTYKCDDILKGVINVNTLTIQNSQLKPIIKASGKINIKEKNLNISIDNKILQLDYLNEYTNRKKILGDIKINGQIKGSFKDLKYEVGGSSNEMSLSGAKFNNLLFNINGDLNKINLKNFSIMYLQNYLKVDGYKNIKDNKYSLKIEANKINLNLLNVFLEKYGLNNISGMATINVTLENNGNKGFLNIENFSLNMDKYYLKLYNVSSKINLNKKVISIEKFNGRLNEGTIEVSGKLNNLTYDAIKSKEWMEELDYNIDLKLKNVNYKYGDNFRIYYGTDLNFKKNKLIGNLQIQEGEFNKIPIETRNIYQIIADFLFRNTSRVLSASKELGDDFKINTKIYNPLELDLAVSILNGVKLDIRDVNAFVGDVKGTVFANGTLKGTGSDLVLLGEADVRGGSLTLNENTFLLENAIITFLNKKDYLPDVNPTIFIEAKVDIDGDDVGIGINGELKKLRFNVTSNKGNTSGNLRGLLAGEIAINDEVTAKLVKLILNDQISQTFIRPITRKIKRAFGLSKFRIKSNVIGEKRANSKYSDNSSELQFDAILEAEKNIYKDKLFLVTSVTLVDQNASKQNAKEGSNSFDEYDVALEYRYKPGRTFNVGVGRVPENKSKDKDEDEKSKKSLNYHVGFQFEKKYDNIFDILKK